MTPRGGARPRTGPKPKPEDQKAKPATFKFEPDVLEAIRAGALRLGLSQSKLIAEAVRAYLDAHPEP